MSFSYNPALPGTRDHLRLALGDTDSTAPLLADETIDAKFAAFGYLEALAQLAEGLASKASQDPTSYDEGSGGMRVEWRERTQRWLDVAKAARSGGIAAPAGSAAAGAPQIGTLENPDMTDARFS